MIGIVDWVTKEYLLREFCKAERLEWGHPWLEAQDLEYHQIDPDRSLGLPLAKAFVELQNGTLVLASARGAGTTATVTLPRRCLQQQVRPVEATVSELLSLRARPQEEDLPQE